MRDDEDDDSSSSFLFPMGGDPAGANLLASINLLSHDALRKEKKDERSSRNRHNQPQINHTPTSFEHREADRSQQ